MTSKSYLHQQLRELKQAYAEESAQRDALEHGLAQRNIELQASLNNVYNMATQGKPVSDILVTVARYQKCQSQ